MPYGFVGNAGVIKELCSAIYKVYLKFGYGTFLCSDIQRMKRLTKDEKKLMNMRKLHNDGILVRSGWTKEAKPQRLWRLAEHAILYAERIVK